MKEFINIMSCLWDLAFALFAIGLSAWIVIRYLATNIQPTNIEIFVALYLVIVISAKGQKE